MPIDSTVSCSPLPPPTPFAWLAVFHALTKCLLSLSSTENANRAKNATLEGLQAEGFVAGRAMPLPCERMYGYLVLAYLAVWCVHYCKSTYIHEDLDTLPSNQPPN